GPALPFHDLAHYVVENALKLQHGFYGNIANGYSVEQLSDKNIIKTLGPESWLAEIVTRALQSLASGACTQEQFISMVEAELAIFSIGLKHGLKEGVIADMLDRFNSVKQKWNDLPDGETLELTFG
ncbi:MAG: hypothetical protein ACXVP0_16210, partial [Bacteroidia bacterium]